MKRWIKTEWRDYREGWFAFALVLLATLMAMLTAGCNQQRQRPWPHEPTPDHWLESYWMSGEEAAAKREWEQANPPENLYDAMTR